MIRRAVFIFAVCLVAPAAAVPSAAAHDARPCSEARDYPGDDGTRTEIAAWMAREALKKGIPAELPVMAALVVSGLENLQGGGADSVGYFQMRTSIWDQGKYSGYSDKPELQMKWFLDQTRDVVKERLLSGEASPAADPSRWGEWIAGVERPEAGSRGDYQLRLAEARALVLAGCETSVRG